MHSLVQYEEVENQVGMFDIRALRLNATAEKKHHELHVKLRHEYRHT